MATSPQRLCFCVTGHSLPPLNFVKMWLDLSHIFERWQLFPLSRHLQPLAELGEMASRWTKQYMPLQSLVFMRIIGNSSVQAYRDQDSFSEKCAPGMPSETINDLISCSIAPITVEPLGAEVDDPLQVWNQSKRLVTMQLNSCIFMKPQHVLECKARPMRSEVKDGSLIVKDFIRLFKIRWDIRKRRLPRHFPFVYQDAYTAAVKELVKDAMWKIVFTSGGNLASTSR